MKSIRRNRAFLALVVTASLVAVGGTACDKAGSTTAEVEGSEEISSQLVKVGMPTVEDAVSILTVNGDIRSDRRVTLISQVAGRIVARPADLGDRVPAGGIIATVDHAQLDLAVEQARAGLASAEEQAMNLQSEQARIERLYNAGGASKQQLDQIRTQARSADEAVKQARAALERATITRTEADIRAPYDGVVGQINVEVGDMVSAQVPVAVFVDPDPLVGNVHIPERDIGRVAQGQSDRVSVVAYPGETFPGTIRQVSPIVDETTRMVEVEVLIPNDDLRLKPGMFATVDIEVGRHNNAVMVPSDAVLQESLINAEDLSGKVRRVYYLFVSQNGHAVRKDVALGFTSGDRVEIVDGLSATDSIIVQGHHLLRDGQPIVLPGQNAGGQEAS